MLQTEATIKTWFVAVMAGMIYVFSISIFTGALKNKIFEKQWQQQTIQKNIQNWVQNLWIPFLHGKIFDKFHPLHPDLEVLVSESTWEVLKAKLWATPRKACEGVIRGDVDELVVFHQPMGCFWNLVNNGTNYQPPSTGEFTGCLNHQQGWIHLGIVFLVGGFNPYEN